MQQRLLIIAGSAGSVTPMLQIIEGLPEKMQAAVIVIIHRLSDPESMLQHLIASRTQYPVIEAENQETLLMDHVYLAPANYHLLVEDDHTLCLDASEKVLFSRPSIDVLLESAAPVFKNQLVAIVLSGANEDGAAGAKYIHQCGGVVLVQHPETCEISTMTKAVLQQVPTAVSLSPYQLQQWVKNQWK